MRKGLKRFADLFNLERRRGGSADCFSIAQVYILMSDSPALFVNKTKVAAMGGGSYRGSQEAQGELQLTS